MTAEAAQGAMAMLGYEDYYNHHNSPNSHPHCCWEEINCSGNLTVTVNKSSRTYLYVCRSHQVKLCA